MRRGTTPTITLDTSYAASEIAEAWITFSQAAEVFTKTLDDEGVTVSDYEIKIELSQEDTLKLDSGPSEQSFVKVKGRMRLTNGKAVGTRTVLLPVKGTAKEGVI